MSNIVIAFSEFWQAKRGNEIVLVPFYESLISELQKNGNNVLVYINSTYKYGFEGEIPEQIYYELKTFSPDLFIFFNNDFWNVSKKFDCPIIVYDVDSPRAYANMEELRNNSSRYNFIVQQSIGRELTSEFLNIDKKNIECIYPYTIIQNRNVEKSKSIVFGGSVWLWSGCREIISYLKAKPTELDMQIAKEVHNSVIKYENSSYQDIYKKHSDLKIRAKLAIEDRRTYLGRNSGFRRIRYLSDIADLGLEIYGNYWDQESMCYFPDVALCWNATPVVSASEWENVLNKAKIGFQIGHLQAISGFSWKVIDIMASGACLVCNKVPDLERLFPKKLPLYTSEVEAREICQRLLNNENERKDIVAYCNEQIDKKYRPCYALSILEQKTGVKLRLADAKTGVVKKYLLKDILHNNLPKIISKPKKEILDLEKIKSHLSSKLKYKIWKHLNKQFGK